MAEVKTSYLQRANTTTGVPTVLWTADPNSNVNTTKFRVDVRNSSTMSAFMTVTGGTVDPTFTFETTADPQGLTGWAASAVRQPGGGVYAATAITQAVGDKTYYFDPTDNALFVRINQTAGDRTVSAWLTHEV